MICNELVKEKLINIDNYSVPESELVMTELLDLHSSLIPLLNNWYNDESIPDYSIENYSYTFLTTTYKLKPVAAILTLDWLVKDPNEALKSLNYYKNKLLL